MRYDALYTSTRLPHNNDNDITYKNKIHKHSHSRVRTRGVVERRYLLYGFILLTSSSLVCAYAYACFTRISRIIFIQYGSRTQTHTHVTHPQQFASHRHTQSESKIRSRKKIRIIMKKKRKEKKRIIGAYNNNTTSSRITLLIVVLYMLMHYATTWMWKAYSPSEFSPFLFALNRFPTNRMDGRRRCTTQATSMSKDYMYKSIPTTFDYPLRLYARRRRCLVRCGAYRVRFIA